MAEALPLAATMAALTLRHIALYSGWSRYSGLPGERIGEDRRLVDRRPREDHHLLAEQRRLGDVVGDEDDRQGALGGEPQPEHRLLKLLAGQRVERGEGLVHQQEVGVEDERAGDGDALPLAAGELRGIAAAKVGDAEDLEPAADDLGPLPRGDAADP